MPQTKPVILDGSEPFVQLQLLDATMAEMPLTHNRWRTTVDLKPGAYIARFTTSAWQNDESFLVLPGESGKTVSPSALEELQVRSAAPLERTHAYDRAHAEAVAAIAARKPVELAGLRDEGSLILVLRRAPALQQRSVPTESPWDAAIRLVAPSGEQLNMGGGAIADLAGGVLAVKLALAEGAYELRLVSETPGDYVSQTVFVVSGCQTRVFLLDESNRDDGHISWATARLAVHFTPANEGFSANSRELLAAEELMSILARDGLAAPAPEWLEYLRAANCLTLDLAFCLAQMDPWRERPSVDESVIARLKDRLGAVADAAIICQAAGIQAPDSSEDSAEHEEPNYELREPPMSARAWDIALFAETRNALTIPYESRASRDATKALSLGPWLRFAVKPQKPGTACAGRRADDLLPPSEVERYIAELRDFVTREVTARIQFGSTRFSLAERRFLNLICPRADTTVFRILKQALAVKGTENGTSTDLEEPPSEDAVVQALRLPRATIQEVAIGAIAKLADRTLLPTTDHLERFIASEANEEPVLLEPLELLRRASSGIVHDAEGHPLPPLSILFLRYRGLADGSTDGLAPSKIAALLNSIGFVNKESGRPVETRDVVRALHEIIELLSDFHKIDCSSEGGVWEDLKVSLRSPRHYTPGRLFVVKRCANAGRLSPELAAEWKKRRMSYSISLAAARLRSGLEELEADEDDPAASQPAVSTKSQRSRYEAEVRSCARAPLEDLVQMAMKGGA